MKKLIIILFVLTGCATTPSIPDRVVQMNLRSNIDIASATIKTQSGEKINLGKLPIDGPITVPNEDLEIDLDFDVVRYTVKPSGGLKLGVSESIITQSFVFTDTLPLLKKDFKSYPVEVRRTIVKTINSFDTAINSPKMLFASKVAEAKSELDDLFIQYPDLQETNLFSYLKKMYSVFKISALVGKDIMASDYLAFAKEATGQISF